MRTLLINFAKALLGATPLRRHFFPHFAYNMTASQLVLLCAHLDRARAVPGAVLEVGCSSGMTTVFLNKFMDAERIDKEYVAIDTFAGFVQEDVRHEVEQRGKRASFFSGFRTNSRKWFDRTMRMNGIERVRSIEADVNRLDFAPFAPIAWCLLDVDLYRPTNKALPELYGLLSPGGFILVDDCDAGRTRWDGACQAYQEFCRAASLEENIVSGIGIVQKPAQSPRMPR